MDKPSTLDAPDDELLPAPAPDRRRALVVGALALTALGAGGVLLLGGGGADAVDDAPVAAPAAQVAVTPAPSASPPPSPAPPVRSTGRSARNPFLVLAGAQAAAPAAGGATATAPAAPGAAVPDLGAPAGTGTGSGPGTAPGTGGAPLPGGVPTVEPVPAGELALVGVQGADAARSAVFTVGGTRETVAVADSFGPDGSLLLLSLQEGPEPGQWTAVVQRGQADPFDVVTGQPVALA